VVNVNIYGFNKDHEDFYKIINENNDFLLFTHSYPDGDALGSVLAFYKLLLNLGKKVFVVCNSELPYQYKFLYGMNKIIKSLDCIDGNDKEKYISIFVDCADLKRIRINYESILNKSKVLVNIDHHLSNTYFGDINIVFPEKSATSEIIYVFLEKYFEDKIDKDIAESLYTGILTDTGKFQYSNTTKEVHRVISRLLEFDINPSKIYSNIYENEPLNRFKLLEAVFRRTRVLPSENLVYSYITRKDFLRLNLPFSANDGIIEILRTAKNIKVAALFKEVEKKVYKVSLRSSDELVNVAKIAEEFGGGGHKMASAYVANGDLKKAVIELNDAINKNIGKT